MLVWTVSNTPDYITQNGRTHILISKALCYATKKGSEKKN